MLNRSVLRLIAGLAFAGSLAVPQTGAAQEAPDAPPSIRLGEGEGSAQPDPRTGAFVSTYAFSLPSARGLSGPGLALQYNSSTMDGSVAYGWRLDVPSIEVRQLSGLPRFDSAHALIGEERYAFNGQPLVFICQAGFENCPEEPSTSGHPAWAVGWKYYRLQVEGTFARFYRNPDLETWRVIFKGGEMVEFGRPRTDFSTYGVSSAVSDWTESYNGGIVRWLPAVRRSLNHPNNAVVYRWAHYGTRGIAYLTDIWDTPQTALAGGSSDVTTFAHHTQLRWSAITHLPTSSYAPPYRARPDFKLDRVGVASMPWSGAGPREVYRVYTLGYDSPRGIPVGGASAWEAVAPLWQHTFLRTITQTGHCQGNTESGNGDIPEFVQCASLPATTFDYSAGVPLSAVGPYTADAATISEGPPNLAAELKVLPWPLAAGVGDIDRDGLPDIIQTADWGCRGLGDHGKDWQSRIMVDNGDPSLHCVHLDQYGAVDEDVYVRDARPMLGYLNRGQSAYGGPVFAYRCMDTGPLSDPLSISSHQVTPGPHAPQFLGAQGNTLFGAIGSSNGWWGRNGYLPFVARHIQEPSGGAEPAASGCHFDSNFSLATFAPTWQWQTVADLPWTFEAQGASNAQWNIDINGDGYADVLEPTLDPNVAGPYHFATVTYARKYSQNEQAPTRTPPSYTAPGPALVPHAEMVINGSYPNYEYSAIPAGELWGLLLSSNHYRVYYADVTGDGLVDAIAMDYNSGTMSVRPGHGDGVFKCTSGEPWPCVEGGITPSYQAVFPDPLKPWLSPAGDNWAWFEMADVTGDGLADIVRVHPGAGGTTSLDVWVNLDGQRFACVGGGANPCTVGSFNYQFEFYYATPQEWDWRLTFADMDADGVNEAVFLTRKGAFIGKFFAASSPTTSHHATRPGQLIRIRNGRGAQTVVRYASVQDLDLAARLNSTPWAYHSPAIESVVTEVRTMDDTTAAGGTPNQPFNVDRRIRYTYRDPGYDGWSRRFTGFRRVAVQVGDEPAITETTYWLGPCENATTPLEGSIPLCPATSDDESAASPSYRAWVGKPVRVDRYVPEIPGQSQRRLLWSRYFEYDPPTTLFSTERHVTFAYAKRSETHYYNENQAVSPGYVLPTILGGDDIELPPLQLGHRVVTQETLIDSNGTLLQTDDRGEIAGYDLGYVTQQSDAPFGGAPHVTCDANWNCLATYVTRAEHLTYETTLNPKRQTKFTYAPDTRDLVQVEGFLDVDHGVTRAHSGGGDFAGTAPRAAIAGWKVLANTDYSPDGVPTLAKGPGTAGQRTCARSVLDSSYGQFARTVKQFVDTCDSVSSLETKFTYDRGFGVAVITTAPDDGVSMVDLDPFGRVQATFAPKPDAIGEVRIVADVEFHDAAPASSVETRTYTSNVTYIRSVSIMNGVMEPVMGFSQGDGGDWIVGGWTLRDASGRTTITYRPFVSSADPVATAAAAGLITPPVTTGVFTTITDEFGRTRGATENGAQIEERTPLPLAVIVRDREQLVGSHTGASTRTETNGHGQAIHTAQTTSDGILNTYVTVDSANNPTAITRLGPTGESYTRTMVWDSLGRLIENIEPNTIDRVSGRTIRYAWNDENRVAGTSDGRGCGENLYYDALGRVTAEDYSPCRPTQALYTEPNAAAGTGFEVINRYDAYDPAQVNPEVGFADDQLLAAGRLTSVRDRGSETHYNYDIRGHARRTSRRVAKPLSKQTPGDDPYAPHWFRTRADFDFADRPASRSSGADDPEFIASGASGESYSYSGRGLPYAIGSSYGSVVTAMTYDEEGKQLTMAYGDIANTTAEIQYDSRQRLSSLHISRSAPSIWSAPPAGYTAPGPETTQTTLLDLHFDAYDEVGNPTIIRDGTPDTGFNADSLPMSRRTMQYDDLYRVKSISYAYGSGFGSANWRSPFRPEVLASDHRPAPLSTQSSRVQNQTFSYDFLGNTKETTDDVAGNVPYDRSLGTINNGDAYGWGPNQLVSAQGVNARYDEAGNLIELTVSRPGECPTGGGASRCAQWYAYDWDEVGQLAQARRWDFESELPAVSEGEVPSTTPTWTLTYAYSGDGRVVKTSKDDLDVERHTLEVFSTLRFERDVWSDEGGDYERSRSTTHVYLGGGVGHVFYDDALPALPGASNTRLYLHLGDHLGSSSITIEKTTGELVERATFQAYGATESDFRPARWNHSREPYKFTGKEEDIEVGATYFGARYYNPYLGRFISADPLTIHGLGSDLNPYAYVAGRTLNHTDPTGLDGGDDGFVVQTPTLPSQENGLPTDMGCCFYESAFFPWYWIASDGLSETVADGQGGGGSSFSGGGSSQSTFSRGLAKTFAVMSGAGETARYGEIPLWGENYFNVDGLSKASVNGATSAAIGLADPVGYRFALGIAGVDVGAPVRIDASSGDSRNRSEGVFAAAVLLASMVSGARAMAASPAAATAPAAASRELGAFEVGEYSDLRKGAVADLDAHHVGQKAVMRDLVPGYDPDTAPAILVPKVGHTRSAPNGAGVVSRSTKGFTTPRDVIARDVKELRRMYPDVPNSALQKLIRMNKDKYGL